MKTVALWTIKGGVGKTAAAVNLAHAAAGLGVRVLLWDLDPQGSASYYLRAAPRLAAGTRVVTKRSIDLLGLAQPTDFPNLLMLPADISFRHLDLALDTKKKPTSRLAHKLASLGSSVDLVLFDCAPSVSLVSEAVIVAADMLLAPVIPSTLSLRALVQVRSFVSEICAELVPVVSFLSMVDRRKRMHRELATELAADPQFLETAIPFSSRVERMGETRAPVAATHPSHPAAGAFAALWSEIAERLW